MRIISANRPDKDPPEAKRFGWPLGLNPTMDQHAQYIGVLNWSCLSPHSNRFWVRRDGEEYCATFKTEGGYPEELKDFDRRIPERETLKIFKGKTR